MQLRQEDEAEARSKKGSRVDAGIALVHLYMANEEAFRFFKSNHITDLSGYTYIGSVTL